MDEERRKWLAQYAANIGAREVLRLGCAIITGIFISGGISTALDLAGYSNSFIISAIFFIIMFVFAFIAKSRKPMYSLLRKILGNENLPTEPMPRSPMKISHQPRPWWSYLPGIWFLLLDLIILYIIIRHFFI